MLAFYLFLPLLAAVIFYCFMLAGKNIKKCLIAKTICSSIFVIIGLIFFLMSDKIFTQKLILAGLVLGALGDIILDIGNFHKDSYQKYFLCGGGSFLLGHFAYIVALFMTLAQKGRQNCNDGLLPLNGKYNDAVLLISSAILVLLLIILSHKYALPAMHTGKSFKLAVGAYLIIVATAAALATSFGICLSLRTFITYSVGLILFLISDSTLMTNMFGDGQTFRKDCIIIPSYYLAQYAIALTLYLPGHIGH